MIHCNCCIFVYSSCRFLLVNLRNNSLLLKIQITAQITPPPQDEGRKNCRKVGSYWAGQTGVTSLKARISYVTSFKFPTMHYRLLFYGVRCRHIFSIVETTSLNKIGEPTSVQFIDTLLRPLDQCFFLSDNKDLCSILPYPHNCRMFRALNRK
jgi:hypothetical protein